MIGITWFPSQRRLSPRLLQEPPSLLTEPLLSLHHNPFYTHLPESLMKWHWSENILHKEDSLSVSFLSPTFSISPLITLQLHSSSSKIRAGQGGREELKYVNRLSS